MVGCLLLVQVLTLLSPNYRVMLDTVRAPREAAVLRASVEMMDVFSRYARPDTPAMLWYCSDNSSLGSIASLVLLFTVQAPFTAGSGCSSEILQYEHDRLTGGKVRYVLVLDESGESMPARMAALKKEGYEPRRLATRSLGETAYHATLNVIELPSPARVE
jgi:hypothetical protein